MTSAMGDRDATGIREILLVWDALRIALLYVAFLGIGVACLVIGSTTGRVVGVVILGACVAFGLYVARKFSARHS